MTIFIWKKQIILQKMDNVRSTKDMINPSFDDLMGDLSFEINDKDGNYIPHVNYRNPVKEEIVTASKAELKNLPAACDQLEKGPLEIIVVNIKKEVIDNDYEEHEDAVDESNRDESISHEQVFVKCEVKEEEEASCESVNSVVKEEELIDDPVLSDTEADPLELTNDIAGKESEVCVGAESIDIRSDKGSCKTICDSFESIEKNGFINGKEGVVGKIEEIKCSISSSIDAKKKRKTKTSSVLKQLKCHYCDKYLSGYTSFKTHLRIHTGEKPYFCNCCNNSFRQYSDLQRHVRSHTGEKPFTCEYCKKSFNRSTNLKTHLRIHTGERPFSCEFCPKSFSEASNLKVHLRTHTGEKPFLCKFCDRTFGESGHFRHHIRTHTGEKPFTCQYCKKSFYQSTHLKNHVRTHTGERPFPCNLCQKSFTRASCLRNHLQRIHK